MDERTGSGDFDDRVEPQYRSDDRTACFVCETRPAVWRRFLTDDRLVDKDGTGFALGGPLFLCDSCDGLFRI
ncbi:hypothetical protein [uncultured Jatrophihabitans sp.]|uniref:hypothetical protein n=1 Tax=uncultured Jatrophihabitans sp. TaxID=1610747 RepID=UPI0035CC994A